MRANLKESRRDRVWAPHSAPKAMCRSRKEERRKKRRKKKEEKGKEEGGGGEGGGGHFLCPASFLKRESRQTDTSTRQRFI